jgi:hypothetical protein
VQLSKTAISQPDHFVRFMFYNTENFFDYTPDSLYDDKEFLPEGVRKWSRVRYSKKLESLYKTLVAAGDWEPPAIIGFCEIENRNVLEDLVNKTYLSKFKYGIIHEDSPDRRGIDVCMIYRNSIISVLYHKYWIPENFPGFDSRSVLYSKVLIGSDTIHFILNHWPSKRGGILNGADKRSKISAMIREKTDSISLSHHFKAFIVISGDFNCSPDDQTMIDMISNSFSRQLLVNLADSLCLSGSGTYRYMGRWEMIDQIIVSDNLFDHVGHLIIFSPAFLMKKDNKYPGLSPYSTYKGYKYQGGFSDHLPVLLDIQVR